MRDTRKPNTTPQYHPSNELELQDELQKAQKRVVECCCGSKTGRPPSRPAESTFAEWKSGAPSNDAALPHGHGRSLVRRGGSPAYSTRCAHKPPLVPAAARERLHHEQVLGAPLAVTIRRKYTPRTQLKSATQQNGESTLEDALRSSGEAVESYRGPSPRRQPGGGPSEAGGDAAPFVHDRGRVDRR